MDPKIAAQILKLSIRLGEVTLEIEHEVALLKATLALKTDYLGMVTRANSVATKATNLIWLTGQIEALRNTEYL